MKRLKYLLPIILLSGCYTGRESLELKPGYRVQHIENFAVKGDVGGVFYALPRTVINIDFEVTRRDHIHGPYAQYASKFLGLGNVNINTVSSFDISDVHISTYNEPDPEQYYFVEMPEDCSMMLELSESGLIMSFNEESEDDGQQIGYFRSIDANGEDGSHPMILTDLNLTERVDTVLEYVSIDTLQIPRMVIRKTIVEKSLEQRAKDAADEIFRIQESKMNLLTGFQEVAYPYETFKYMYEQLDQMEQDLSRLFTGYTYTSRKNYRYTIVPRANEFEVSIPVFRFSRQQGLLKLDQTQGETVSLNLVRSNNNLMLSEFAASGDKTKTTGFVYRIPEYGKLSVYWGKELKAESKQLVNQYGVLSTLSGGYKMIEFYPETGGIRRITQ